MANSVPSLDSNQIAASPPHSAAGKASTSSTPVKVQSSYEQALGTSFASTPLLPKAVPNRSVTPLETTPLETTPLDELRNKPTVDEILKAFQDLSPFEQAAVQRRINETTIDVQPAMGGNGRNISPLNIKWY